MSPGALENIRLDSAVHLSDELANPIVNPRSMRGAHRQIAAPPPVAGYFAHG
jgi:hypothetical protein